MAFLLSFLLFLTGFTGTHSVMTVTGVSVKAGESISIPCLYDSEHRDHVKYLCYGRSWEGCSVVVRSDQTNSEKFSISDDQHERVFTVTIKDLKDEDTGYWWCAVAIDGKAIAGDWFHMKVNRDMQSVSIRVDQQEITAFIGENLTIHCYSSYSGQMRWCRPRHSCVKKSSGTIGGIGVTIDKKVPNVFTVSMSGLTTESSGWYWWDNGNIQMPVRVMVIEKPTPRKQGLHVLSCIIPLTILGFALVVSLFVWFLLKRHKQTRVEASAAAMGTNAEMKSDGDVIYSNVVTVQLPTEQKVETKAEDVIYSTLAEECQNLNTH